jgi:hypothetical protein
MLKKLLPILLILMCLGACNYAYAQATNPDDEKVCISKEAAEKAVKAFDTVKAQEAQIAELKKIIDELKIKTAMLTQKEIDLEAEQKRNGAIIEYLLKNPRKVTKIGLLNF